MKPFGWAVIGPGKIAQRFAAALKGVEGARLSGVHGRDQGRAAAFAAQWGDPSAPVEATTDLELLLSDERIDAFYIATPHAFHAAAMSRCLVAGKPVLCEKPLVANEAQGRLVVELARAHRTFLMEGLWTRFLPVYATVHDALRQGLIGRVRTIQSSFCFNLAFEANHRVFDPAQGGGALLDLGVYNISMTRWVLAAALGECPPLKALQGNALIGPTGVDHRMNAMLDFGGGLTSQFTCGFDGIADNTLHIFGERGVIRVPSFHQAVQAELLSTTGQPQAVRKPHRVNGFEGQIEAAMAAIRAGEIECAGMTHADSLEALSWMDRLREQVGVRYPFE